MLRRELEAWQEEARRKDHIIMNMTEAMKALNPPSGPGPEPRDGHETAAEAPGRGESRPGATEPDGGSERRPGRWLRRFFGFE